MQLLRPLIPGLIVLLLRTLACTLRFRIEDRCGITRGAMQPFIGAFWHNRILAIPLAYQRYCRGRRGHCLTSPSKDGAIIAGVMERFNIGSVRGSSSRRGTTALRELAALLEAGDDIAITPDGPRGPKYQLSPGIVKLAQITGIPVMPIHVGYSRYWEIKSWDAFRIPKPFSRVTVIFGPLYEVLATADDAAFEAERMRLQNLLMDEMAAVDQPPLALQK
ncbi:MAG: lysophospholipid acyltransferase family protein [Verrucomicrobia bacterium]|nr:lysophospholipid acyltransferase family protein [Verrucomicrobiota bacterium]